MPSIFASAMIVFATSLDDFVVSQFLFGDASNVTVPIKLYNAVRSASDPGAQRPGHAAAGGVVPGPDPRVRRPAGARGAVRGRRSRTSPTTADATDDGSAVRRRARPARGRPRPARSDCGGRWTVTGCPVARLSRRALFVTSDCSTAPCGRRTITWVVDPRKTRRRPSREPVGPGEAGLLHLDALRTDHCPPCRRVVAGRSLRLEGEVAVPNVRVAALPGRHSTSNRLATPRKSATNSVSGSW